MCFFVRERIVGGPLLIASFRAGFSAFITSAFPFARCVLIERLFRSATALWSAFLCGVLEDLCDVCYRWSVPDEISHPAISEPRIPFDTIRHEDLNNVYIFPHISYILCSSCCGYNLIHMHRQPHKHLRVK